MVSFANEMNGIWFPWSGYFYGAQEYVKRPEISGASGEMRLEGAETFKSAYRHVVDRVRSRGAKNVIWVFHVNNYNFPSNIPWIGMKDYYPGSEYVDWLGLSVYGQQMPLTPWTDFELRGPYDELANVDSSKPMMIAEWGVGEFPERQGQVGGGDKAGWIQDAFQLMTSKFPRIKAAIYWNERWQNGQPKVSGLFSDLRVNSSPESLEAYRAGAAFPYWIGYPQVKEPPTPGRKIGENKVR